MNNHSCCDHDNHHDHKPLSHLSGIVIHGAADFLAMEKAGLLAAQTLDFIAPYVKPGITTDELNTLCHDFIVSHDAIPAPLHYRGFPKSICTSVNHVVCHGIPGSKKLKDGDIINIDVTTIVNGWHGDTSRTFCVGNVSRLAQRLVDTTYEAMMRAIDIVKPGVTLGDIGYAIESFVRPYGYSIVEDFCGHGIGRVFHTEPTVLHYGKQGTGTVLETGMFFTIEPMINAGKKQVKILNDEWTVVTRDQSLSAQFEHTIGVTDRSYQIFTQSHT